MERTWKKFRAPAKIGQKRLKLCRDIGMQEVFGAKRNTGGGCGGSKCTHAVCTNMQLLCHRFLSLGIEGEDPTCVSRWVLRAGQRAIANPVPPPMVYWQSEGFECVCMSTLLLLDNLGGQKHVIGEKCAF